MLRETRNLEFKQQVSNSFLKTVSAFANFGDGQIHFGVDEEGTAHGFSDPPMGPTRRADESDPHTRFLTGIQRIRHTV
ncbi:AlbA family DNA-binding domain-containing protein [Corynebacterium cystitidis]|uniref:AlbA family DNA-binding domain-containing protein n=1 Tax=Corynebacterium cystitidis TaxID=35757 RepID=UPI00358DD0E3